LIDELIAPRKRGRPYAGGRDPLVHGRAPREIVETVKHLASQRKTTVSVIMREALTAYLRQFADRPRQDRAA
jgi:Ribbon-helix-helix protein, copG family